MEQQFRRMQRATVARSALDIIALVFLFAGFAFWGVAFWQLLSPPALLSLLSIQAAVLAVAFSLAAPLLLSMLVPTTPAGQLLQKTQWATVGFYVILAAALFLVYQAEQLIEVWLYAQPAIADVRYERRLAIVLVIAFVVVPALAWVQLTPERWAQQIQQAHAVKKLEMQQRGELAIIKASLIRAERLALKGWANLLPLERAEVFGTVRGLLMSTSDTQRTIVRTLGLGAELERDIMSDDEIAQHLDYVAQRVDVLPDIAPAATAARENTTVAVYSPHSPEITPPGAHVNARLQSSIPRDDIDVSDAARRHTTPGDAAYLRAARDAFGRRPWTLKQLAAELKIGDTSAGELRDVWIAAGSARQVNLGRWTFDTQ